MTLDEEFFFPQNIRTGYRLWIFSARHLRRLVWAPVCAVITGWPLLQASVLLGVVVGSAVGAGFAGVACVPVFADEQTVSDALIELHRHRQSQTWYR